MKHRIALIIILICVIGISSVYGQEVTPDVTPVATVTQTSIPTIPPATSTLPSVPSLTNTIQPTVTPINPTLSPTGIITVVPVTITSIPETATDVLPLTETVSPVPIATETESTSVATLPAITVPIMNWSPIFIDSLTTPRPDAWIINGQGWRYITLPDASSGLELFDSATEVLFNQPSLYDVGLEVWVDVEQGDASLVARANSVVRYEGRLTSDGQVILLRGNQLISSVAITNFDTTQPHLLRLNVVNDLVWITVDNQVYIAWQDTVPLPPGQVGFSAGGTVADALPVGFTQATIYQPTEQASVPTPVPTDLANSSPSDNTFTIPDPVVLSLPDVVFPISNNDITGLISAMNDASGQNAQIDLAQDGVYTFSNSSYTLNGSTALPIVESGTTITINGNGATLSASSPGFRLFGVDGGTLILNDVTISGFQLNVGSYGGSALYNNEGTVDIDNVTFDNNWVTINSVYAGGTIQSFYGTLSVKNSSFNASYTRCVPLSSAVAIEHFLSKDFEIYQNQFNSLRTTVRNFLLADLPAETLQTDKSANGYLNTVYFSSLDAALGRDVRFLKKCAEQSGAMFISGSRNHMPPNAGFCFRINLASYSPQYDNAFRRLISWLNAL